LTLVGTSFISNTSARAGGAHTVWGSSTGHLVNVPFVHNTVSGNSAALHLGSEGNVEITHATLANSGLNPGQAIQVVTASVAITNSGIAYHAVGIENAGGIVWQDYNLFYANTDHLSGTNIISGARNLSGAGVDADFINPAGDDFQIGSDSSAPDNALDLGKITDLDGAARPLGGGPDRGAYEAIPRVFLPLLISTRSAWRSTTASVWDLPGVYFTAEHRNASPFPDTF